MHYKTNVKTGLSHIFSKLSKKKPTTMRFLILASLASFGLAAPQNSFFVLTRGTGARESTSYIDYSTGLRSSSFKVASAKVIRPTIDCD